MNGAQALIRTLVRSGVDTCFTNPGTSEMHFVAALDHVPAMRGVLGLFEGVATGAADGYARMTDRPAAVLLHLGPGLGNGLANLHNARRAHTPVVTIVGDHATFHRALDAPLQSDIESVARNVSSWIRSSERVEDVAADGAAAVAAALGPPGEVVTLVLPADVSWCEGASEADPVAPRAPRPVPEDRIAAVAGGLRGDGPSAVLLGGKALRREPLAAASRIAAATGSRLLAETFPARLERGAGVAPVERLAYLAEFAQLQLDGLRHLVLVDAAPPVSFFAYPGKASTLTPAGCEVHVLADGGDDVGGSLEALATALGATDAAPGHAAHAPVEPPSGDLTAQSVAAAVAAVLPEGAILSDESNTSGLFLPGATAGCPPHDVLTLTGGAIGQGLPVALGAAVACPDRPVLCLEADGSAMYTLQALWTMAREGLDVTTVILNNASYAVLGMELERVGAPTDGAQAAGLFDLSTPPLDFVGLARAMGVPAVRVGTADELVTHLGRALAEPGPSLLEARVPKIV